MADMLAHAVVTLQQLGPMPLLPSNLFVTMAVKVRGGLCHNNRDGEACNGPGASVHTYMHTTRSGPAVGLPFLPGLHRELCMR